MKRFLRQLIIAIACFGPVLLMGIGAALMSRTAHAQGIRLTVDPKAEVRYCGPPARDADGTIHRSSAVIYAFRQLHPCPLTGKKVGACPRWQINHIWPLASGGCDAVSNMMWLPVEIKTCSQPWCVDRWERTYWGDPAGLVIFPAPDPPPPAASG